MCIRHSMFSFVGAAWQEATQGERHTVSFIQHFSVFVQWYSFSAFFLVDAYIQMSCRNFNSLLRFNKKNLILTTLDDSFSIIFSLIYHSAFGQLKWKNVWIVSDFIMQQFFIIRFSFFSIFSFFAYVNHVWEKKKNENCWICLPWHT